MKRLFLILPWLLVLLLGAILLTQPRKETPFEPLPTAQPTTKPFDASDSFALVSRVIDGDTIEIETGQQLRYIGIDTPERGQCLGDAASDKNKELVLGKKVRLEKDISETDRFGRLLRYVWLDNVLVNEELVRSGFAKVSTFPPDVKYVERFLALEREARAAKKGLWDPNACPVQGVQSQVPSYPATQPANCQIKGNISTKGEKIYHVLGCGSYEKTIINEEKGERWFCSEEEAISAGWRKAKNCP